MGDDGKVYTAAQVLTGERDCGDETVVIGGGLVGCETALWLAQHGKKVTIVEALDKLLAVNGPLCHANKDMLERLVPYHGVETVTSARVTGYAEGVLTAVCGGKERQIQMCIRDRLWGIPRFREKSLPRPTMLKWLANTKARITRGTVR